MFQNVTENYQQTSAGILEKHMTIRPDFYFRSWGVVLDAKNRPVWEKTLREEPWSQCVRDGIREDVYQVLSYMLALNCHDGGVIFPVRRSQYRKGTGTPTSLKPSRLLVSGIAEDWRFWRVPFLIPDDEKDYEAFRDAVKQQADAIRTSWKKDKT